jgi:hypothetical protein
MHAAHVDPLAMFHFGVRSLIITLSRAQPCLRSFSPAAWGGGVIDLSRTHTVKWIADMLPAGVV